MSKRKWTWTNHLTELFVFEADELIRQIKEFKDRWGIITRTHQKPTKEQEGPIIDKQMDISDCMDDFQQSEDGP